MKIISLLLTLALPLGCYSQTINTYAGNGILGYGGDGGLATNAELDKPVGVFIDKFGSLLICQHDRIREVRSSSSVISNFAGDTSATTIGDGGPATNALIDDPRAICADAVGNLYIADYWADEVRKIDIVSLTITDYAGIALTPGYSGDGGPATAAKLSGPVSICIDTNRRALYISDPYSYRIRKVDMLTGTINTYAGTGVTGYNGDGLLATNAKLSRTLGICLDDAGNLYIGDWDNGRIRKIDVLTSKISTIAGTGTIGYSGDGGSATSAMVSEPGGLCFDTCGNLFFSDGWLGGGNYRIRTINMTTGIISTVAGSGLSGYSGDGGSATAAMVSRTAGICFDRSGSLFVADIDNNRVREVTGINITCPATEVESLCSKTEFNIYPNPASNTVFIAAAEGIVDVEIQNLLGQAVKSKSAGSQQIKIDVAGLPRGIYILKVNGIYVQKILKE